LFDRHAQPAKHDPFLRRHDRGAPVRHRCGDEYCDDLDVLRFDPAFKLACGRLAETGRDLMSQPTLSRIENAPSWRELPVRDPPSC